MRKPMRRTTIWLRDEDDASIQAIRSRFGAKDASDAIRLALNLLATSSVHLVPENRASEASELALIQP